jgi:hypothetical protein
VVAGKSFLGHPVDHWHGLIKRYERNTQPGGQFAMDLTNDFGGSHSHRTNHLRGLNQ